MFGMFFLGVLYLQQVLGYDALRTGLAFLPTTVVMGTLSLRYTGRLIGRFGARRLLLPGLVLIAAGLALFARVPVHGNYWIDVLPSMILLGTGVGISFPALATLAMSGATGSDAGLASGLVNTTMQVGAAVGLSVLATLSATRTAALAAGGASTAVALTGGYRLALLVGVGLVLAAMTAVTVVRSGSPADSRSGSRAGEPAGRRPAGEPEPAYALSD
jgi:MFS family permease